MRASLFLGKEAHEMQYIDRVMDLDLDRLAQVVCNCSWSPFIFKVDQEIGKRRRHKELFDCTDLLVFDIDEVMTIDQAIEHCKGDEVVIATTKSHQVEKLSGKTVKPACDRFRVIKVLERPIQSPDEYRATWLAEAKKLGCVDEQCKDVARFYFQCRDVIFKNSGNKTPVAKVAPEELKAQNKPRQTQPVISYPLNEETPSGAHGRLFPSTLKFLQDGAASGWHTEFLKATMDLKEQGHSYDESYSLLEVATKNYYGYLDEHDVAVLDDVYERRGGKYGRRPYEPRGKIQSALPAQFVPPTDNELASIYTEEVSMRRRANDNALTFLDPAFDEHFKLTYGITLIGGKTGAGKSTVSACLVAQVLLSERCTKRILLLSNEETVGETYSKLACLMLGLDWKLDYRDCKDTGRQQLVDAAALQLVKKVTIVTAKVGEYDTSDLDDVKRVLEYAKSEPEEYALVILDYLQTITTCKSRPGMKPWEISKDLGTYLKKYAQRSEIPVVVFAQLWDEGDGRPDFGSRVQNDLNFVNHCHTALEIVPDYVLRLTTIKCHKQRWGNQQHWSVDLEFSGGRLIALV